MKDGRGVRRGFTTWLRRLRPLAGVVTGLGLATAAWCQPQNMEVVGQTGGRCHAVGASGTTVYMGQDRYLQIIDFLAAPGSDQKGRIALGSAIISLTVSGTKADCCLAGGNLAIVDVSDVNAPTLCGTWTPVSDACRHCVVVADYAYVAGPGGGMAVVDVSNCGAPFQRGTCDLPGTGAAIAYASGIVYVACSNPACLRTVDVTNPA